MGDLGEKGPSARMADDNDLRAEDFPGSDCGFDESLPAGWLAGAGAGQVWDRDRMATFGGQHPERAPAGWSEQRAMDEQEGSVFQRRDA